MEGQLDVVDRSVKKHNGHTEADIKILRIDNGVETTVDVIRVTLTSVIDRNRKAQLIATSLGADPEDILVRLRECAVKANQILDTRSSWEAGTGAEEPPPEISNSDREVALAFLQSPSLLFQITRLCQRQGLVGESANALSLYLAATSRVLDDPVCLLVTGRASTGKTRMILDVLELIPKEWRIVRWNMSAKAPVYSKLSYEHKVIFILEQEGKEASLLAWRNLASEKHISHESVIKRNDTGMWDTQIADKKGPSAQIAATVNEMLDEQDESRVSRIRTDASSQQTALVVRNIYQNHKNPPKTDELLIVLNAQRLLTDVKVGRNDRLFEAVLESMIQAYGGDEKLDTPRIRRDAYRMVSMVQTSAVLHHQQRALDDQGLVIPNVWDYFVFLRSCSAGFSESMTGADLQTCRIYDAMVAAGSSLGAMELSQAQISAATSIRQQVVSQLLSKGIESGYFTQTQGRSFSAGGKYAPGRMAPHLVGMPDLKQVLEYAPDLAVGLGPFFDPISGQELSL